MLRITVELVPHGDESRKHTLCEGEIINEGTGTLDLGDYYYTLSKRKSEEQWAEGKVKGFQRSKYGAWLLLYECLGEAIDAMMARRDLEDGDGWYGEGFGIVVSEEDAGDIERMAIEASKAIRRRAEKMSTGLF